MAKFQAICPYLTKILYRLNFVEGSKNNDKDLSQIFRTCSNQHLDIHEFYGQFDAYFRTEIIKMFGNKAIIKDRIICVFLCLFHIVTIIKGTSRYICFYCDWYSIDIIYDLQVHGKRIFACLEKMPQRNIYLNP